MALGPTKSIEDVCVTIFVSTTQPFRFGFVADGSELSDLALSSSKCLLEVLWQIAHVTAPLLAARQAPD